MTNNNEETIEWEHVLEKYLAFLRGCGRSSNTVRFYEDQVTRFYYEKVTVIRTQYPNSTRFLFRVRKSILFKCAYEVACAFTSYPALRNSQAILVRRRF